MIIVDVNLLIYAVNEASAFHRKAKSWRRTVLGGQRFWAVSGTPMA
jgi:predicted nucleic acid-binding protein